MSTWTRVKQGGLVAAAVVMAAACGRAEAAQTVPAATEPRVVTIVAREFAFQGPDEIPAGLTTIQLQNRGQALHHVSIIKLDEAKTLQDFVAALRTQGPPPAWAKDLGGPNAPDPGSDSNATLMLEPGNYALVCWVDIPDHVPHVMKGMMKAFRVTPAAIPAASRTIAGDVTLTLDDYSFATSKPLTAGRHTIRVENAATQSHEVELVKLAPGKTLADLGAWVENPHGPPPAQAIGGISGMAHGVVQSFTVDLTPGEYGFLCFLPGPDGKPHIAHGMARQFTVQ